MSVRAAPLLALLTTACAGGSDAVAVRVTALGDDPFRGADAVVIRLADADDVTIEESTLPGDVRDFTVGPFPYGHGLSLSIETRLGDLPLGRGRSFPFSIGPHGERLGAPDVTLGVLGRHARLPDAAPAGVLAIGPTEDGALLGSASALARFVAHDPSGRPTLEAAVAVPSPRIGAAWVPLAGGLLAVGGSAPGMTLFGGDGLPVAEATGARAVSGAALVALSPSSALLVGGLDSGGALLDEVIRIDVSDASLDLTPLEPLSGPRTEARAFSVVATSAAAGVPRVLVVDGRDAAGPRTDVEVLDPAGVAPATVSAPGLATGAAVVGIESGQVAFVGGTRADGTISDAIDVVFLDDAGRLDVLSPPPPPLFRARTGALGVLLGTGVVLVLGGHDGSGELGDVEIADLRVLRGRVFFTGSLPSPARASAAAILGDATVLVTAGTAASLYFPPLP